MERIIKYGGKLFFGSLIICILSFFYFKLIPYSQISNLIGYIFLEIFLIYSFYIGYRYKLSIKESLMSGILGCGVGLFLLFFATYTYYIIDTYWGMSLINDFFENITLSYTVVLIMLNIFLVLLGSRVRFIKEKIISIKQKNNLCTKKDFL